MSATVAARVEPEGYLAGVDHDAVGPATPPVRSTRQLLRSSAVVSAGTALSRATGLLRTIAVAVALTTGLADAYNLANTAPNVVYDLILGGVLAATLVPVLVTTTERNDRNGLSAVATVVTVALVALTLLAIAFAPGIVRLYTFTLDGQARELQESAAVPLLRLFLPQVLFYGLTALYSALLNAHRRFAAAAFAPALNNVLVISVLVAVWRITDGEPTIASVTSDPALMWLLGLGTTAGIAAMALVLIPAMRAADIRLRWRPDWRHPAVRRIVRLSGWTLAYVAVNQIGLVILLALANGAAPGGGLSAYSYAYLFFQLPYGLFAVAVMTAFLPELTSAVDRADSLMFRDRFSTGLRMVMAVVLPCAVAYVVLGGDLVDLLFGHGNFTSASGALTTEALVVFGVGLPGYSLFMFTMRGFYARKDTRTPFLLATAKITLMVGVAWPLAAAFELGGVVAAFSGAFTLAGFLALAVLARHAGGIAAPGTLSALGRSLAGALVMLAVMIPVHTAVADGLGGGPIVPLVVVGALGAATYVGVLALTRSPDLAWVIGRLRRTAPSPS